MISIFEKILIPIASITFILFFLMLLGCNDRNKTKETKDYFDDDDVVRLSYVIDGVVIKKFKNGTDIGIIIKNHDGKKVVLHDPKYYENFDVGDNIYFEASLKHPKKEEE